MSDRGAGREDFKGRIGQTVKDSEPWWAPEPAAPDGAPNVLVIVLDDCGFAQLGCFGSEIETPNIDALAAGGLRFTNFHTTALCSPTRACLLSGRNHHSVGMRYLSNVDTGFSNCRGVITPKAATMAEVLREHGYNTFALGKWHLANMEDCTPAGPFEHWPLQRGFDRFYGFLGGATDQFSPELTVDNHPIDPPSDPSYHLSEDLVDQAVAMLAAQRSTSTRPFFMYLAFGATHSPHQAPKAWLDKYRGRFDDGWDAARDRWFARQRQMGIVPEHAKLSPLNPRVEPWDSLDPDAKRLYARMQEAFAAFLDHTDAQIGRLIDFLKDVGALDNTMVVLLSDNGASQEGGKHGSTNELAFFNRRHQEVADMLADIDRIGGPHLYNNYPLGWAQAGNTPLRFFKQNTYEGGIRDPLIVHWPEGIAARGEVRDQYHHVIDIMPTVLSAVGVQAPSVYRGVPQLPVEGIAINYCFEDGGAEGRRTTQYYEMLGHRAVWHKGWKAVTMHKPGVPFEEDRWSLYDTTTDFAECEDLAEREPGRLAEMQQLWWTQAGLFNVLPLDDRGIELFSQRRPVPGGPPRAHRFLPNTPHIDRFAIPDLRNRSYRIHAAIERDSTDQAGVLVACGARTGGYTLFVQDNRPVYEYVFLGRPTRVTADRELPAGACRVSLSFAKTAEHRGTATLLIDDTPVGQAELELMPWRQSLFGMDIGRDTGSSVSEAYTAPFAFSGRLIDVRFEMDDDRDDLARHARVEARNALTDQ